MRPSRSPSSLNPSSPSNNAQRRGREADGGAETSQGSNFKVVIRVRPPLPRELEGDKPFQNVVKVSRDERAITISENVNATDEDGNPTYGNGPYSTHRFTFDTVYGQNSTQEKVYNTTARAVVDSSLQGYNATIFAYGQTGTGKTYTMEGFHQHDQRGIIPRAIEQIFNHISSSVSPRLRFLVRASYLQIYNEVISDLLKPERTNLAIREAKKRGVFVEGLSEWVVRSPEEIYGLMERGGAMRATGSTKMNELSSRSHAVFIIIAEQSETTYVDSSGNELAPEDFHELVKTTKTQSDLNALEKDVRQSFKVGKLNLVDLAGSERVRLSGATGQRLEESKKINQSLSALGNVIAALTDPRGRQHIPYRDSKLTRILEDSLGGNCKTTMMAMVSPALEAILESVSTLKFANRAKNIKNLATINEDMDQRSLLRKYERELKRLRAELENRTKTVVDKRRLLELDEQRRRAEQDKMAAIRALEKRSLEFMREKQEKKRLESKINSLQGQMLMGGLEKNIVATPAFRAALKEQRDTIREEYEKRLADLEMERETIEEEKAQVDRYKQLLLKQRDIMIALTQRLNERDEQIMALQDELDAYDRHQKELEEKLDEKTAALIHLQRVTMEHNANSPIKNADLDEALGGWAPPGQQQRQQQQQQQQQHFQKQGGGSSEGNGGGSGSNGSGSNRSMNNSSGGGGPLSTMASPGGNGKEGRRQAAEARRAAGTSTGGAHKAAVPQKQYEPYNDATVFVGSAVSAQPGEEQRMLSADEKIRELAMIVDKQKSDQQKLSRELEEVQAEKVRQCCGSVVVHRVCVFFELTFFNYSPPSLPQPTPKQTPTTFQRCPWNICCVKN